MRWLFRQRKFSLLYSFAHQEEEKNKFCALFMRRAKWFLQEFAVGGISVAWRLTRVCLEGDMKERNVQGDVLGGISDHKITVCSTPV